MTKYIKLYKFIISTLLLLFTTSLFAQDLSKLSPDQLEMYNKYKASQSAAASTPTSNESDFSGARSFSTAESASVKPAIASATSSTVFGSYLFSTQNLTFEPKLNIATPPNYILGTSDELIIDISGLYDANFKLKVSPEGYIRIPNIGPIKVSGIQMQDASRVIRNQVSKVYSGIASGETKVNVTLGDIRSIRVTVVGEAVRPGTYTLPSLATAFNALYSCGGPNPTGTMRDIKVIRNGKIVAKLDVYRYLIDGLLTNNIALQDEDVLRIDPYKIRTTISGAVKREGIFESLPGETTEKMILYAGGFADNAYKDNITLVRLTKNEKTVIDLKENMISSFLVQSGDAYTISSTFDKFNNRVTISGSIYRPGMYALKQDFTVLKLIQEAAGIKEDAYLNMAYITRKKTNQIPEIIGFNLGELLNAKTADIVLQKDDEIEIRSLFDYRAGQSVTISGAVKSPGEYQLIENITLKDLIFKAKGFTEIASTDSIELIRPIKDPELLLTSDKKSTVMKFSMDKDLNLKDGQGDMLLENGDLVIVRSIFGYEGIRTVSIEGEVYQPGTYNIKDKAERISDLLSRAGGFTNYAYPTGAFLIRKEKTTSTQDKINSIVQENSKNQLSDKSDKAVDLNLLKATGITGTNSLSSVDSIQNELSGNTIANTLFNKEGIVGINLEEIMHNPGCKYDLKLEDGDIIFVPRELQTVKVVGQVLFPTLVRFDKGMSLKNYINNSGGFAENANKKKVFVLYANGSAKSTKSFLGMRCYPKIYPGARIVIPEKPIEIKNPLSAGETIGILTSITSVAALVYTIIK